MREIRPDHQYKIVLDENDLISSFSYCIDDNTVLTITNAETGLVAEKIPVPYERKVVYLGGIIKDNRISSMGEGRESTMLALQLSDIFAWDVDFTTDLRENDIYKVIVEGFYLDGRFQKYGDILAAEFINNGRKFSAYGFGLEGKVDYFDEDGKSLPKEYLAEFKKFKDQMDVKLASIVALPVFAFAGKESDN